MATLRKKNKLKHINMALSALPHLTLVYFPSFLSVQTSPFEMDSTTLNKCHFSESTMLSLYTQHFSLVLKTIHSLFCLSQFYSVFKIYLCYCFFQKDFSVPQYVHQIGLCLSLFYHSSQHKSQYFITNIIIICICV